MPAFARDLVEGSIPHRKMRVGNGQAHPREVKAPGPRGERLTRNHRHHCHRANETSSVVQGFGGATDPTGIEILMVLRRFSEGFEPGDEAIDCGTQRDDGIYVGHESDYR